MHVFLVKNCKMFVDNSVSCMFLAFSIEMISPTFM